MMKSAFRLGCWSLENVSSAPGRVLLYAVTGVEVPVLRSKLLFPKRDFQQFNPPESANSSPSSNLILVANLPVSSK